MKTAVSLPDAIFEQAEHLAKRRGLSRSELYARAIADYVHGQRFMGVRERLDAVYAGSAEESTMDAALEKLQALSLSNLSLEDDEW